MNLFVMIQFYSLAIYRSRYSDMSYSDVMVLGILSMEGDTSKRLCK
jgi:hypothetical protein